MAYFLIVIMLLLGDAYFLWWAHRRLGQVRNATVWRALQATLIGGQFLTLAWFVCMPGTLRGLGGWFWRPVSGWLYMWHLLVLPATLLSMAFGYAVFYLGGMLTRMVDALPGGRTVKLAERVRVPAEIEARPDSEPDDAAISPLDPVTGPAVIYPSRRQLLTAAATFVPQAVLGATLLVAARQVGTFRVRRLEVSLPQLPRGLDGMTIAHLSDTHVGRFVGPKELEAIVEATAGLRPDAIAFTGDLIDFNLADLPPAITALKQLQTIAPLAICVGNHDLFEDGRYFRARLRTAELGLMLNEPMRLTVRGERVEMLGLDWGLPGAPRADGMNRHLETVLSHRNPSAFSVLLAHHPHAFDTAAAAGVPLTLSGHTHGGQIMVNERLGAGNVYRYWSGQYQQGASRLVVSNGVGNWFPLRVNAPAEIIHLTLRTA